MKDHLDLKGLTIDQLLNILKTIFKTTYVKFGGHSYVQCTGVPAGQNISSFLTDAVLDEVDKSMNVKYESEILTWLRFMDDIWTATKSSGTLDLKLVELNSFHKSLQFTREYPVNGNISFLDLQLSRSYLPTGASVLNISHFIKPTQTTRSIGYTSAQPKNVLHAIVKGECNRAFNHSQTTDQWEHQSLRILEKYKQNGYPIAVLQKIIDMTEKNVRKNNIVINLNSKIGLSFHTLMVHLKLLGEF